MDLWNFDAILLELSARRTCSVGRRLGRKITSSKSIWWRLQGSSVLSPGPDWRRGDLGKHRSGVYDDEGRVKNIPPGGLYARIETGCSSIKVEVGCSEALCFFSLFFLRR